MIDKELAAQFCEEVYEHLDLIEQQLLAAEGEAGAGRPCRADGLTMLMRELHSLKGAANMVGLADFARLCHVIEGVIEHQVGQTGNCEAGLLRMLLEAQDELRQSATQLKQGGMMDPLTLQVQGEKLEMFLPDPDVQPAVAPAPAASPAAAPTAPPPAAGGSAAEADDTWDPAENGELINEFVAEGYEIIERLDQDVVRLEADPGNREVIDAIFRGMHTLKGNAGLIDQDKIKHLAHQLENIFDGLRKGEATVSQDLIDALLKGIDFLRRLVDRIQARQRTADICIVDYLECLARLHAGRTTCVPAPVPVSPAVPAGAAMVAASALATPPPAAKPGVPGGAAPQSLRVAIAKLDKAMNLVGELVINKSRFDQQLRQMAGLLPEVGAAVEQLERLTALLPVELDTTTLRQQLGDSIDKIAATRSPHWAEELMPRMIAAVDDYGKGQALDAENRQLLLATVQDLTRVRNVFEEFITELSQSTDYVSQITSELQQAMTKTRMVAISQLFNKYPRLVRDLAHKCNKQVELVLRGEETELDKAMVDDLADPLMHLIRNSLDHGIEAPAARVAAGKPPVGQLLIAAYYAGSQVVVEITDDGRGIDPAKLRESAVRKGLLTEAAAAALSNEEALNLIFMPGFSTAAKVTEISGRGVGMDVVKNCISKLKGSVEMRSVFGTGTTLKIYLPLTMAIIQVLLIRVQKETYAIPLAVVAETMAVPAALINWVGNREVFNLRGQVLPVIRLDRALQLPGEPADEAGLLPMVVVTVGQKSVGVIVDQLLGRREVVIKNLGTLLKKVRFVSSSTILGDGSAILILDLPEIVDNLNRLGRTSTPRPPARPARAPAGSAAGRSRAVLVVDDSASIRQVLRRMLLESGFEVAEAENGLMAVELARTRTFDAVLMDIMMPKLNGYEAIKALRGMPAYQTTPILIISSKGEKLDKKRGFDAGADDYLTKPTDKAAMLDALNRLLALAGKA